MATLSTSTRNTEGMNKTELLEYAESLGISGLSSRNLKGDILAAIEAVTG